MPRPLSAAAKWAVALGVVVLLAVGAMIGLNLGGLRGRLVRSRGAPGPVNVAATGIPVRPAQIRPAVAVLGFKNLSGRPDEAWLSIALAEMLTTEVGAGEKLRTIPGENVARMKTNLSLVDADSYGADTLRKIHASIGSDYVLLGSYLALGNGQVRLDLRLENASSGELLSSMSARGTELQIAELVARVGVEVRTKARSRPNHPRIPKASRSPYLPIRKPRGPTPRRSTACATSIPWAQSRCSNK
jgi:TolB-like protein